jgi:hypothetical protein
MKGSFPRDTFPRFVYCHVLCVTTDGVRIREWIYWPLIHSFVTTSNYSSTAISTIHKSSHHSLSFSSVLCLYQSFPGNGFYQCRFFSFTCSGSIFTASRTELPNYWLCPLLILVISRHGPCRNTPFSTVTLLLVTYLLPRKCVYRAVAQKRQLFTQSSLSNGPIRHTFYSHSAPNSMVRSLAERLLNWTHPLVQPTRHFKETRIILKY